MQFDLSDKPLAWAAYHLAHDHHAGIFRKYTGEKYIRHPERIVATLLSFGVTDQETLAMGFLHDCMEDENLHGDRMSAHHISAATNSRIARGVELLTCPSGGNRASRKQRYNDRLSQAPANVQAVKLADILDNISGIARLDRDFAGTYLDEKQVQWESLRGCNMIPKLVMTVRDQIGLERNILAENILKTALAEEAEIEAIANEVAAERMLEFAIF